MESTELLEEVLAEMPAELVTAPAVPEALTIAFASPKLHALLTDWKKVEERIEQGRANRIKDINIEALRSGPDPQLLQDEMYLPVNVIDTNIRRAKPGYLQYLIGPVNLVFFTDPEDLGDSFEDVATAFNTLIKYTNWEEPHLRAIDCAIAHFCGAVEVLFDKSAPGRVSVEYVALNDLIIPLNTEYLHQQLYVMRRYRWTNVALKRNAKEFDFDHEATEDILEELKERVDTADIYKVYIREPDGLYIAWWCDKCGKEWLKAPIPFDIGLGGIETQLPIIPLLEDLVEDSKLLAGRGECEKSKHTQTCVSGLESSLINQTMRAANPVFSPEGLDTANQEPLLMKAGTVAKRALKMHKIDPPDPNLFSLAERIRSQNLDERGQVNYAVNNRTDSRKTATEVMSADAQAVKLQSVSVLNLANYLRGVYTYAWRIVKHYALKNEIFLLGTRDAYGNIQNDFSRIDRNFLITPTGGSEQARVNDVKLGMEKIFPLVRGTALEKVMISDYLRYALPTLGAKYQRIYKTSVIAQDLTLQIQQGIIERIMNGQPDPAGNIMVLFTQQELQQFQQTFQQYQNIYGVLGDTRGSIGPVEGVPSNEVATPEVATGPSETDPMQDGPLPDEGQTY